MHIILADDTAAGPILHQTLARVGLSVRYVPLADLSLDRPDGAQCVILRSADTDSLVQRLDLLRALHGDTILVVILAASERAFRNALSLYRAGADAVLAPCEDAEGLRRVLEHLACLASIWRRSDEKRAALRREPDLIGTLLGSVAEHIEAASLLFDQFRLRVTAPSGALYELSVERGIPVAAQRIDDASPICSLDKLLQVDQGCFMLYAATPDVPAPAHSKLTAFA